MSATSEHFLTPAAGPTPRPDRFNMIEMDLLRTLSGRMRWVGVIMLVFGVLTALLPLLGHITAAALIVGLIQGALMVLLGEMTRRVGIAFVPPAGGQGRSADVLLPGLKRLSGLYGVYLTLCILGIGIVVLTVLYVIGIILSR
ncbi:MAG TPA: hypothetical protein PKZ76_06935 [Xanthomonadaceae bacterium]|nr:hypothetical protein [Xanthomonadaceae bacterium]